MLTITLESIPNPQGPHWIATLYEDTYDAFYDLPGGAKGKEYLPGVGSHVTRSGAVEGAFCSFRTFNGRKAE